MTLRKTEIIEWSTTPAELRRIADELEVEILKQENNPGMKIFTQLGPVEIYIVVDQAQLLAEQAEGEG